MSVLKIISRILIGSLFTFSGYVKAIDPLGFKYKIADYIHSFGMDFLIPYALIIAVLIIAAEFAIGLCLLCRIKMDVAAWFALIFMTFFTILTFYIALAGNVVKDCGCFGSAVILTNWETFFKNIVALPFIIIIFLYRKKYKKLSGNIVEYAIAITFLISGILISAWSIKHLPIIDFTAYKVGTNIPKSMEFPKNAKPDIYKTTYFYSKNGETKEFDETNYPWNDSTWVFVSSKSQLVQKGYEPPIHDFSITTPDGNDITDSVINSGEFNFILILQKTETADTQNIFFINKLYDYCTKTNNCKLFAYTASNKNEIDKFIKKTSAQYEFTNGDETTIKTMIRSNPGLMLIKDGNIWAKWSYNDFPKISEIEKIKNYSFEKNVYLSKHREKRTTIAIAILIAVTVILLNAIKRRKK